MNLKRMDLLKMAMMRMKTILTQLRLTKLGGKLSLRQSRSYLVANRNLYIIIIIRDTFIKKSAKLVDPLPSTPYLGQKNLGLFSQQLDPLPPSLIWDILSKKLGSS